MASELQQKMAASAARASSAPDSAGSCSSSSKPSPPAQPAPQPSCSQPAGESAAAACRPAAAAPCTQCPCCKAFLAKEVAAATNTPQGSKKTESKAKAVAAQQVEETVALAPEVLVSGCRLRGMTGLGACTALLCCHWLPCTHHSCQLPCIPSSSRCPLPLLFTWGPAGHHHACMAAVARPWHPACGVLYGGLWW